VGTALAGPNFGSGWVTLWSGSPSRTHPSSTKLNAPSQGGSKLSGYKPSLCLEEPYKTENYVDLPKSGSWNCMWRSTSLCPTIGIRDIPLRKSWGLTQW
jgi:hypothetical protein